METPAEIRFLLFALDFVRAFVVGYLALIGPGHAWWTGEESGLPKLFARVVVSVCWTSLLAVGLALVGKFSIPTLILVNAAFVLTGYLLRGAHARTRATTPPVWAGLVVAALALVVYWPAYPTFLAGQDSSAYLATGIHVAREGRLSVDDELGVQLPNKLREQLFRSHREHQLLPPYARSPGGLIVRDFNATRAWPSFFPLPSIWAAISLGALGGRHANAYAPVFAALGLWAFWIVARRRLSGALAAFALAGVALNGANYFYARFAMSETLALFFLWSGVAAWDSHRRDGRWPDAALAGAALGAAVFTRIEIALYLALAWCWLALAARSPARAEAQSTVSPLALPAFTATFATMLVATAGVLFAVPGNFATPLLDSSGGAVFLALVAWARQPFATALFALLAMAVATTAYRRWGGRRPLAVAALVGIVGWHGWKSDFLLFQTLGWLQSYLGIATLLAGVTGSVAIWRDRDDRNGNALLVAITFGVAIVLLQNAHVQPSLPWAIRRFVPWLLPAAILAATVFASRVLTKSLPATLVVLGLVVWGIVPAGAGVWGKPFFEGTAEQLDEFARSLPPGPLLIDSHLNPTVLGPVLWLAYERPSVPVPTDAYKDGANTIAGLTGILGKQGPVYLLKRGGDRDRPIPYTARELISDYRFEIDLPFAADGGPPDSITRIPMTITVHRLNQVNFPKRPPSRRIPANRNRGPHAPR